MTHVTVVKFWFSSPEFSQAELNSHGTNNLKWSLPQARHGLLFSANHKQRKKINERRLCRDKHVSHQIPPPHSFTVHKKQSFDQVIQQNTAVWGYALDIIFPDQKHFKIHCNQTSAPLCVSAKCKNSTWQLFAWAAAVPCENWNKKQCRLWVRCPPWSKFREHDPLWRMENMTPVVRMEMLTPWKPWNAGQSAVSATKV